MIPAERRRHQRRALRRRVGLAGARSAGQRAAEAYPADPDDVTDEPADGTSADRGPRDR